jgi:hypothetical protein
LYEYTPSGSRNKIIEFPFSDFIISAFSEKKILLTTRPSGVVAGFSYIYDISTGIRKKILSSILGLGVQISYDGSYALYSRGDTTSSKLYVYSTGQEVAFDTKLSGLSDKCTWGDKNKAFYCGIPENLPENTYPDSWYKGLVQTSDTLYKIDTKGQPSEIINLTEKSGQKIDIYSLFFDTNEKNLFFINKYDASLWVYDFSI